MGYATLTSAIAVPVLLVMAVANGLWSALFVLVLTTIHCLILISLIKDEAKRRGLT